MLRSGRWKVGSFAAVSSGGWKGSGWRGLTTHHLPRFDPIADQYAKEARNPTNQKDIQNLHRQLQTMPIPSSDQIKLIMNVKDITRKEDAVIAKQKSLPRDYVEILKERRTLYDQHHQRPIPENQLTPDQRATRQRLNGQIINAHSSATAIPALVAAMKMNFPLDPRTCIKALELLARPSTFTYIQHAELAIYLLPQIVTLPGMVMRALESTFQILEESRSFALTEELMQYVTVHPTLVPSRGLLRCAMSALALSCSSKSDLRRVSRYRDWIKRMSLQLNYPIDPIGSIDMAAACVMYGDSQGAISALEEFTSVADMRTAHVLLQQVLRAALHTSDLTVLNVLVFWLSQLSEVGVEYGTLTSILRKACSAGDSQLTVRTYDLLALKGYQPTQEHFYMIIRSLALMDEQHLQSLLDVVQDMTSRGEIVFPSLFTPPDLPNEDQLRTYRAIQFELVAYLFRITVEGNDPNKPRMLDHITDMFYQRHSTGLPVPPVLLDALIECAGRLQNTTLAYKLVDEYEKLSGVRPGTETMNSLMKGVSIGRVMTNEELLSLFQDMERLSQQPLNSDSYTILFTQLLDYRYSETVTPEILGRLWDQLLRSDVGASPTVLRRLKKYFEKHNHRRRAQEISQVPQVRQLEYILGNVRPSAYELPVREMVKDDNAEDETPDIVYSSDIATHLESLAQPRNRQYEDDVDVADDVENADKNTTKNLLETLCNRRR